MTESEEVFFEQIVQNIVLSKWDTHKKSPGQLMEYHKKLLKRTKEET